MSKTNLPEIYKTLREEKGLTIKELSQKINCNEKTISFYENGERELSIGTLQKYADFFNVSTDYLLGRTERKTSNIDHQKICELTGLTDDALCALIYAATQNNIVYYYGIKGLNHLLLHPQGYEVFCNSFEYIHAREILKGKYPDFVSDHPSVNAGLRGLADIAVKAVTNKDFRAKERYKKGMNINMINDALEELKQKYEKENPDRDSLMEEIREAEEYLKKLQKEAQNNK